MTSAAPPESAPLVAVLIPCLNEEAAISQVVSEFRRALPRATIFVYDNNSTDRTAELARVAGATVRTEARQGKGNVLRRMFADVEADAYVLVDGDDTYDPSASPALVERLLTEQLDMINVARVTDRRDAYPAGHQIGNRLLTGVVGWIFGNQFQDMLSGYRVLSRRFVKSFPALSAGFEIETELTVHALSLRMPLAEVQARYKERPAGSTSKLRTFKDGLHILKAILILAKEERPLAFFACLFAILAATSAGLAYPLFVTFEKTGLVPRLPTAVLATGIMILAFLSLASGMILDTVTRGRRELKRLHYLGIRAPH